jgi:hypothetical protein
MKAKSFRQSLALAAVLAAGAAHLAQAQLDTAYSPPAVTEPLGTVHFVLLFHVSPRLAVYSPYGLTETIGQGGGVGFRLSVKSLPHVAPFATGALDEGSDELGPKVLASAGGGVEVPWPLRGRGIPYALLGAETGGFDSYSGWVKYSAIVFGAGWRSLGRPGLTGSIDLRRPWNARTSADNVTMRFSGPRLSLGFVF